MILLRLGFIKILELLNARIRRRLAKCVSFAAGFSLLFWLVRTPVKSTVDGVLLSDNVELIYVKVMGVRLVMLLAPMTLLTLFLTTNVLLAFLRAEDSFSFLTHFCSYWSLM